ncbi:MAG: low-complexity tail membrane protein [Leptolyngbya sp. SIOISBB]|nr:low-complexity tail membrane protein [Leptolyngbya sp. SIOISBB]
MLPHRRDPYLWIHLAGLATVPFWLDVCLVGLAVGEPVVPSWLELTTLALVGTLPIVWMQLKRPFYIFSLPGLALRPDKLADERRRLLTLQQGWLSRGLVLFAAIVLWCALYWLYQIAPVAADLPWLMWKSRATGWGICAIAFFCANLFTLVPATVVSLFLASSRRLEQVSPFDVADILQKFTVLGWRVGKILPEALSTAVPLEKLRQQSPQPICLPAPKLALLMLLSQLTILRSVPTIRYRARSPVIALIKELPKTPLRRGRLWPLNSILN